MQALELDEARWVPQRDRSGSSTRRRTRACGRSTCKRRRRSDARQMIKLYDALRGGVRAQRRGRFRRAAAARLRALARQPGAAAHYRHAVPARAGRRVPGHERHPVRAGAAARRRRRARRSSSATTTSRSTAGAARASRTCSSFRQDYPGAQLVPPRAELPLHRQHPDAANALIANNTGRLGKKLWTERRARRRRSTCTRRSTSATRPSSSSTASATGSTQGGTRRDVAILYRSNAQSRVFEEDLLAARIPYRVYGGLRFFERAEIKDALAYLRLIVNRDDDAVVRARREPADARHRRAHARRAARARARQRDLAVAGGARMHRDELGCQARAAMPAGFLTLIEQLDAETRGLPLHEQVDHVIQASGPRRALPEGEGRPAARRGREPRGTRQRGARLRARRDERHAAARRVPRARGARVRRRPGRGLGGLRADDDAALGQGPRVPGGVPVRHGRRPVPAPALGRPTSQGLEEERRLCYVGTTRAMRQLYLTYAEQRRLHGVDSYGAPVALHRARYRPSCVEEVRPQVNVSRPATCRSRGTIASEPAPAGSAATRR